MLVLVLALVPNVVGALPIAEAAAISAVCCSAADARVPCCRRLPPGGTLWASLEQLLVPEHQSGHRSSVCCGGLVSVLDLDSDLD